MEQPKKKIEDLTLEEALNESNNLKLRKAQIDVTIADFKEKKSKLKSEKARLKESKSKKLKSLQDVINKSTTKSVKDSKRKSKIRESESFDSQIASKERQIESVEGRILGLEKEKKHFGVIIKKFKQHIDNLKK